MQLNYYNTIEDLPIKIWFDIHKTGDYTKLLIDPVKFSVKTFRKLFKVWEGLYDEYMVEFGLSDDYHSSLRARLVLARLQAQYIRTNQAHFKTLIAVEKEKIRMNSQDISKPSSLDKTLAKMSKFYGVRLRSKELSVSEYYSYIENITNG